MAAQTILVAGATGSLGGRVVRELLKRGKRVRALVREGSNASQLEAQGVEIARGDMLDPASLERAMNGVRALVTTAIGYSRRRKGDSLEAVDDLGNRNLVDAARKAKLERFVFTSILTCEKAPSVPHFWQKKLIEDYLEASGVPFVSLRPGAYIGDWDLWTNGLKRGRLVAFGSSKARWTNIHVDDVARDLALAVDEPRALGKRIDLGMERPLSIQDMAAVFSKLLNREIQVRTIPWWLLKSIFTVTGLFSPFIKDGAAMFEYFLTGQYVADTTLQAELFGPIPTVEGSLRQVIEAAGLEVKAH